MQRDFVQANVVIVAQQFNPTVISQLWLVRNGLVAEDDFQPGSIFTDAFVQVFTRRFILLVTPLQLQLVPIVPEDEQEEVIVRTIGILVRTLPHTPFAAMGINFTWHLMPDNGDVGALSRRLFFVPNRPLFDEFDVPDANFGVYLSKNIFGYRLKLDVKPVVVHQPEQMAEETPEDILRQSAEETTEGVLHPQSRLQVLFNYHAELGDNAAETITRLLPHWREAVEASRRIVESIPDGDEP